MRRAQRTFGVAHEYFSFVFFVFFVFFSMLIAVAVFCALCEAVFTALEVAMSAVSRARLRAVIEAELVQQTQAAHQASLQARSDDDHNDAPIENKTSAQAPIASAANPIPAESSSPLVRESREVKRASRVLRLLEQPERLTPMFITVTSLSLWTAASCLTWHAHENNWPWWGLPLSLLGVLFVAEVLPLLLAARRSESVALGGGALVKGTLRFLRPVLWLVGGLGHAVARALGAGPNMTTQVNEGELRTALATAEEEGVIDSDERAMLEGAMDFRETLVREVMTPRADIVGIRADAPLPDVLQTAMHESHSRLPVYEGTLDTIVGIIATKDLIPHLRPADQNVATVALRARDVARPPFFVPQNKRIAPTLEELRRQRSLMAVVIDEDGGTAGLVTLEDLLEEIVGEIQDEYDEEEPTLRVWSRDADDDETRDKSDSTAASDAPTTSETSAPVIHQSGDSNENLNLAGAQEVSRNNSETDKTQGGSDTTRTDDATRNALLCDARVNVRDCERFWKRSFDETMRLQDGEETDGGMSLAAWALQLFGSVPPQGARLVTGRVSSHRAAEAGAPSSFALELEITRMNGARIEEIKLEKVARESNVPT